MSVSRVGLHGRLLGALCVMAAMSFPEWSGAQVPYLVEDIDGAPRSSNPASLADVNGILFFTADDGATGTELWKSDGTAAGTVLVKDIAAGAGSSGPSFLTNVNGILFFSANDGASGNELWRSNGTMGTTVLVKDIAAGPN